MGMEYAAAVGTAVGKGAWPAKYVEESSGEQGHKMPLARYSASELAGFSWPSDKNTLTRERTTRKQNSPNENLPDNDGGAAELNGDAVEFLLFCMLAMWSYLGVLQNNQLIKKIKAQREGNYEAHFHCPKW